MSVGPALTYAAIADPALSGRLHDGSLTASVAREAIAIEIGAAQGIAGPAGPAGPAGRDGVYSIAPQRSYPMQATLGQTVFPVSPPPTDYAGFQFVVNGNAYHPPSDIQVSAVSVTWLGGFALGPNDQIYFYYS